MGIREQKDELLVVCAALLEDMLQIVLPLLVLVVLGDFDGEGLVLPHEGGQPSETGPARPSHSDQQRVSSCGPQDPRDSRQVADRVLEEHQIHRLLVHVVVHQIVVEFGNMLQHILDLDVILLRTGEIAKN